MNVPSRSSEPPVGPKKPGLRWNIVLVVFLRLVAMAWLGKGLLSWATILTGGIEGRATTIQAIVIYFALIDVIAGVGLWLTATWGGVLWVLAITSYLILGTFFPRVVVLSEFTLISHVLLIAGYLTLSWLSAQERG